MQRALLKQFLSDFAVTQYALWYHTPMALEFTMDPRPNTIVYDCMDELSGFLGAPAEITRKEMLLFEQADVVFTGDMSLYEAKKKQHYNVHAFPSSIDVDPFAKARTELKEPSDQASIAHPRAGFFGVLDERFDHALLNKVASARPEV